MIAYFAPLATALFQAIAHKLNYNHEEETVLFIQSTVYTNKGLIYLADEFEKENIFTHVIPADFFAPRDIPLDAADEVAERRIEEYFDNLFSELKFDPHSFDEIYVLNDNHGADFTIYFNLKKINYTWVQVTRNGIPGVHPVLNKHYGKLLLKYQCLGAFAEYAKPCFRADSDVPLQQLNGKPYTTWNLAESFNNINNIDLEHLYKCYHLEDIDYDLSNNYNSVLLIKNSYGMMREAVIGVARKKNKVSAYVGFDNYPEIAIFSVMDKVSLDFYTPDASRIFIKCHINCKFDQSDAEAYYGVNATVLPNVAFQVLSRYFKKKSIIFGDVIGTASSALDESTSMICQRQHILTYSFSKTWWFYISIYTAVNLAKELNMKRICTTSHLISQVKLLAKANNYDVIVSAFAYQKLENTKNSMIIVDLCDWTEFNCDITPKNSVIAFLNDSLSDNFIKTENFDFVTPLLIKKDILEEQPCDILCRNETVWVYSANRDTRQKIRNFTISKTLKNLGIYIHVDGISFPESVNMFKTSQMKARVDELQTYIAELENKITHFTHMCISPKSEIGILRSIDNINEYLDVLSFIKEKYIIFLSVKDTPGDGLTAKIIEKLKQLGFSNFSKELWRMYAGVVVNGHILCDKSADEVELPVIYEYKDLYEKPYFYISSHAWRKENKSEIIINGVDYSANIRGINIVVYDNNTEKVLDSIGFDNHGGEERFIRKEIDI